MSNLAPSWRKFLECTSRIRIHGHGRWLGAKNQDPNFGPGNRSLYRRTEDKRPIFKFSPRGLLDFFSKIGFLGIKSPILRSEIGILIFSPNRSAVTVDSNSAGT